MNIIVTPTAEADMMNIFNYIASDNFKKAAQLLDIFESKFNTISLFPKSGFKRPEIIKKDVRFYMVANHYQIVYMLKNDTLYILRVLSGYQDILSLL